MSSTPDSTNPSPFVPPPGTTVPSAASGGSPTRTVLLAVLGTLAAIGVIAGGFMLGRTGEPASTSTTTTTDTSTTDTSTTVPPPASPAPVTAPMPTTITTTTTTTTIGAAEGVRGLPRGLFCRNLEARGFSYAEAVEYWNLTGQPDQMDADRNGIPCETVYPRDEIIAFWPVATYEGIDASALPSGLLCRDLKARGVGVYDALRYYLREGVPARMDADGNGIPCETVYPDAAEVWESGF